MKYEMYTNKDGSISKYVHNDGSETSIKTWPEGVETCGGSGRNKFNVFASCSVGCAINCEFCFLTSKKFPYKFLDCIEIAQNVVTAIKSELIRRPELKDIPFNLSWMGMGDGWPILDHITKATYFIMKEIAPLVSSIEGVDIATTLPSIRYNDINFLDAIDSTLRKTGKLTPKPDTRTNVRIFYSLHSMFNNMRTKLIPHTINVNCALPYLEEISKHYNVIYHYLLLNNFNDFGDYITELVSYFHKRDSQLRILRYNTCPNSIFTESDNFNNVIDILNYNLKDKVKIQLSPGSEISAACGMFLMKESYNYQGTLNV